MPGSGKGAFLSGLGRPPGESYSELGMLVNRFRNAAAYTLSGMSDYKIKDILWGNVLALMEERYGRENINRLAREAKVGVGTVSRMKEAKTSVGVNIVEKIAGLFKMEAFELLMPPKVLKLYRTIRNKDFLVLCDAYNETDERGREFLLLNAQTLLQKARKGGRGTESG